MSTRMNDCKFVGNLTRDPELRYVNTPDGEKAVCNFGLAVQRMGKDAPADFLNFVVWDKRAEALAEYKKKGDPLLVSRAEARYRTWENDEGQKRSTVDFLVFDFQFLRGKRDDEGQPQTRTETVEIDESDFEDIPF